MTVHAKREEAMADTEFKKFAHILSVIKKGENAPGKFTKELFEHIYSDLEEKRLLEKYEERTYKGYYYGTNISRFANLISEELDVESFAKYIESDMDDTIQYLCDSFHNDIPDINNNNYNIKIAEYFKQIIYRAAKPKSKNKGKKEKKEKTEEWHQLPLIDEEIEELKKHSVKVTVPENIQETDTDYIFALFAVYGEMDSIPDFNFEHLKNSEHCSHFKRQRKDFFSAVSTQHMSRDVYHENGESYFQDAVEDVCDAVIDLWEKLYWDKTVTGRQCLDAILDKAVGVTSSSYLTKDTSWITVSVKKGICHILVNTGDLKGWVKK